MQDTLHSVPTRKRGLSYLFTGKHHGGGTADDACWSKELMPDEEFSVFETADILDILDDDRRFYGVLRDPLGDLHDLGTWQQQIAVFTGTETGPWHGYPVWPVDDSAPSNRAAQRMRPSKSVFAAMQSVGLISAQQRKRLEKGNFA